MAKTWGKGDCKQLKALRRKLQTLEKSELDTFCEIASKELAARLLALVIPRTPVGHYDGTEFRCITADGKTLTHKANKVTGKNGGTLRRGWTGGETVRPDEYAQNLPIEKRGNTYIIEVINPMEYASFVEFGYHSVDGKWVEGHNMLRVSEDELEQIRPALLQKMLDRKLWEVLGG